MAPSSGPTRTGRHPTVQVPNAPDGAGVGAGAATTADGKAAAALVTALAKAARAFTLYDPGNAIVRSFLVDYHQKAVAATEGGTVVLDVEAFRIVREGEIVYEEEDREKSLSFRLFRDGVRRVVLSRGVVFPELLHLLEILAVRYTGVRQQEDDIVTLLRKAEFKTLSFQAVEGFVPDEENPEPMVARDVEARVGPPATFDTPFPALGAPVPLAWREVPDAALAELRAEEAPEGLAPNALRATARLLAAAARGAILPYEVGQLIGEIRDFFLADQAMEPLADLAGLVAAQPAGEARDVILRALGDPKVLEVVLSSVAERGELPPAAARLVPFVPAAAALDLLATEPDATRRTALLKVVEARLPAEADAVMARLGALDAASVRVLARAVATRAPARTAAVAAALLDHPDPAVQATGLDVLGAVEGELPVARVVAALRSEAEVVRVAAARLLERKGEADAFAPLQEALGARAGLSHAEAEALGRALAMVHPPKAAQLFGEWLRPRKGILQRTFGGGPDATLRWAAVSGLGAHPSPAAVALLEDAAKSADEELRRHCLATLARRRGGGARHG
jgi:hypothetical protein